jgi:hypothetical protein
MNFYEKIICVNVFNSQNVKVVVSRVSILSHSIFLFPLA